MATNFDRATGTAGTLRIRDTGTTVEFWILCTDPVTNVASLAWTGRVNGVNVGGNVSLPAGFSSRLVGSWTVTTGQTVTFNIAASGTQGIGGPTNHSAAITRAAAPGTPGGPEVHDITLTGARFTWTAPSTGGAPTTYGLYVSTVPTFATHVFLANLGVVFTHTLDLFDPGTTYYARVRAQNAAGAGPYTPPVEFRTLSGAYVSDGTTWHPADIRVSDGTTWHPAAVDVSDGSTWRPAG